MTLSRVEDFAPTRLGAAVFELKACLFRLRRLGRDALAGPARLPKAEMEDFPLLAARSRTPLWAQVAPSERTLQRGKVQNLRAAARRLDGTLLAPGAVFSFWKQLGRASRRRGFARGRMLKEGCIVPATGGGLCQLSNALYDVALQAGLAIVERHAHSRRVPGAAGRDATVAWNYVDLRFRSARPLLLRIRLTAGELVVELMGRETAPAAEFDAAPDTRPEAESCESCDRTACFRHGVAQSEGRRAVLVDELWPEFDRHVEGDLLCLPMTGRAQYGWSTGKFAQLRKASFTTLCRALSMRLAKPGPRLRALELAFAERLARRYAKALDADVTDLVVAQSLLPALWRDGHLGGRSFEVLMTRLPMAVLQARLDDAARAHPERASLADFRADATLESEALAAAQRIVTPHREIAALFGERALLLDWVAPKARIPYAPGTRRVAFPGPAIARKGAFELREAARALDLEVVLLGSDLEGRGFWDGVRVSRDLASGVAAMVQPALVEDKPRKLLAALASGVPVIATRACGLGERTGLTLVAEGDAGALTAALAAL